MKLTGTATGALIGTLRRYETGGAVGAAEVVTTGELVGASGAEPAIAPAVAPDAAPAVAELAVESVAIDPAAGAVAAGASAALDCTSSPRCIPTLATGTDAAAADAIKVALAAALGESPDDMPEAGALAALTGATVWVDEAVDAAEARTAELSSSDTAAAAGLAAPVAEA